MKRPRPLSAIYSLFERGENDFIESKQSQTLAQEVSILDDVLDVEHAKYVAGVATTAIGTLVLGAIISVVHKYPGLDVDVTTGPDWFSKTTETLAETSVNIPHLSVIVYGGFVIAEAIEIRRAATARMDQLQS